MRRNDNGDDKYHKFHHCYQCSATFLSINSHYIIANLWLVFQVLKKKADFDILVNVLIVFMEKYIVGDYYFVIPLVVTLGFQILDQSRPCCQVVELVTVADPKEQRS